MSRKISSVQSITNVKQQTSLIGSTKFKSQKMNNLFTKSKHEKNNGQIEWSYLIECMLKTFSETLINRHVEPKKPWIIDQNSQKKY